MVAWPSHLTTYWARPLVSGADTQPSVADSDTGLAARDGWGHVRWDHVRPARRLVPRAWPHPWQLVACVPVEEACGPSLALTLWQTRQAGLRWVVLARPACCWLAVPLVDAGAWLYAARYAVGTGRRERTPVEGVREHLRRECIWRLCGGRYPTLDLVGARGLRIVVAAVGVAVGDLACRVGVRVWPPRPTRQERERSAVRPRRPAGK